LSDLREKLQQEAQLTIFSNRISEKQEKNLKLWPFCFFESVSTVNIEYDLGHGIDEDTKQINHKSTITYYLVLDEEANKHALDKRFAALGTSVRALFWKDIIVKVYFNDKLVFENKYV
jgi:hypothetical protein